MPSLSAMKMMAAVVGGAAIAGRAMWKHSAKDETMDTQDRVAATGSLAIGGAVAGLGLNAIGARRLASIGSGTYKTTSVLGKAVGSAMMARPSESVMKAMGKSKYGFGTFKALHGPTKLAAMAAATVGTIAIGARKTDKTPRSEARGQRDEYGDTQYNTQSVKERVGMMGASGSMVFGMHNTRHG